MVWNKLFSRTYLNRKNLRFEEDMIHEDEIFTFATSASIHSAYIAHHHTYSYRVRQNSIMLNDDAIVRQLKYRPVVLRIVQNPTFDIQNALHRVYLEVILGNTYAGKIQEPWTFWRYYQQLRHNVNYTPYKWYKPGIFTRKQLKANIH